MTDAQKKSREVRKRDLNFDGSNYRCLENVEGSFTPIYEDIQQRSCLSCIRMFRSLDRGNRICYNCSNHANRTDVLSNGLTPKSKFYKPISDWTLTDISGIPNHD